MLRQATFAHRSILSEKKGSGCLLLFSGRSRALIDREEKKNTSKVRRGLCDPLKDTRPFEARERGRLRRSVSKLEEGSFDNPSEKGWEGHLTCAQRQCKVSRPLASLSFCTVRSQGRTYPAWEGEDIAFAEVAKLCNASSTLTFLTFWPTLTTGSTATRPFAIESNAILTG